MLTFVPRSSASLATFSMASLTPSMVSLALFCITTTVGGLMAVEVESLSTSDDAATRATPLPPPLSLIHTLPDLPGKSISPLSGTVADGWMPATEATLLTSTADRTTERIACVRA